MNIADAVTVGCVPSGRIASDGTESEVRSHGPGSGYLQVVSRGSRSVVTRAFASSPLRLLMPRNHGGAAWVYTATYGGGLVDGDALRLGVDIGRHATALVASQAATKVYRSPGGTSVELVATVRAGGVLIIAPDPLVCFAGARYRQEQRFDLDGTAGLVFVDWFSSGRHASGERWKFDRYASRVTVRRDGRLVLLDALSLGPDEGDLARRMGRFDVFCTVALIGRPLESHAAGVVAHVSGTPVGKRADLVVGASAIADDGCIVRIAGMSIEQVGRAVREVLRFVPSLLGDDPWARKW